MDKDDAPRTIKEQVARFVQATLDYHSTGDLIEYLTYMMRDGKFPVPSEHDWHLFMQLCHNHIPDNETELRQYIDKLDTHYLVGLAIDKGIEYDGEGVRLLLTLLKEPHFRKCNELIFDRVDTFPLVELSQHPMLFKAITIVPSTSAVKVELNPEYIFFHTYSEEKKRRDVSLVLINTRKVDSGISKEEIEHSLAYIKQKVLNRRRLEYLTLYEGARFVENPLQVKKHRYSPDTKVGKQICETVRWLLSNDKLSPLVSSDYKVLSGSWSLCIQDTSTQTNPQQYYIDDTLF